MLVAVCAGGWFIWSFGHGLNVSQQTEAAVELTSKEIRSLAELEAELSELAGEELLDPFARIEEDESSQAVTSLGNAQAILQLPSLQQVLPVYLGATNSNLYSGTAFVAGSDLPTEVAGTRVVIAGHRGYYGQLLFLYLNYLTGGAPVFVYFNGQQYEYQVTGQTVVAANDVTALLPVAGERLLTLITCTPIPTFDKRLLVHAKLVGITNTDGSVHLELGVTSSNSQTNDGMPEEDIQGLNQDAESVAMISDATLLDVLERAIVTETVDSRVGWLWRAYPYVTGLLAVLAGVLVLLMVRQIVRMM